jgi:hypothetical protein
MLLQLLLPLAAVLTTARAQLVNPAILQTCATETTQVTVTAPGTVAAQPIDVFFLLDDTGTFEKVASQLANQFVTLVKNLAITFPNVDFGYGVGRFEDFGGTVY